MKPRHLLLHDSDDGKCDSSHKQQIFASVDITYFIFSNKTFKRYANQKIIWECSAQPLWVWQMADEPQREPNINQVLNLNRKPNQVVLNSWTHLETSPRINQSVAWSCLCSWWEFFYITVGVWWCLNLWLLGWMIIMMQFLCLTVTWWAVPWKWVGSFSMFYIVLSCFMYLRFMFVCAL